MWKKYFLSILLCGILGISNAIAQNLELEIITEEWAPFNYKEAKIIKGFSVEIVQAIMEELGEKNEIVLHPGARSEKMLDTMPNIMNFSLFRTSERESKYKWIGPLCMESLYFYKRKNDPRIFRTIADVKKVERIAVFHEGLTLSQMKKLGITNTHGLTEDKAILKHVILGRSDLCVMSTPIGNVYNLKKLNQPIDALVKTNVKLLEFPLYIACSKEIPDNVISKWQRALDKIKSSGRYEQIYNKYLR